MSFSAMRSSLSNPCAATSISRSASRSTISRTITYSSFGLVSALLSSSTTAVTAAGNNNNAAAAAAFSMPYSNQTTNGKNTLLSPHLIFHHLTEREPVRSTQDEARKLLRNHTASNSSSSSSKALAVLADIQWQGRGTQGRRWERATAVGKHQSDGNLYLTVCLPLERVPVTLTLLPLQIGALVAERVSRLVRACTRRADNNNQRKGQSDGDGDDPPKVTVKWPNDVLVNQQKISGTLIENENVILTDESDGEDQQQQQQQQQQLWLLVGIGVNVASAPRTLPGKQVRPACCVQDFCPDAMPKTTALALGQDLASALADWVYKETATTTTTTTHDEKSERERQIRERWLSYAEFGQEYELRGQTVDEEEGGYEGERVVTVGLEDDGQLRVRGRDGRERKLVADYMF